MLGKLKKKKKTDKSEGSGRLYFNLFSKRHFILRNDKNVLDKKKKKICNRDYRPDYCTSTLGPWFSRVIGDDKRKKKKIMIGVQEVRAQGVVRDAESRIQTHIIFLHTRGVCVCIPSISRKV